jgi:hypothetical protein
MSRHISDQPRNQGSTRMREFIRQERETGTHPAVTTLRTRPQERDKDSRKAAQFLRIERGRLT